MSRAYRIRVSETVTKTVHVEDGLSFRLELLDVVDPERTQALVAEEAEKIGFLGQEDGTLTRTVGEVEVTLDPKTGEVTVRLDASATVTKSGERTRMAYDDQPTTQGEVEEELSEELEQKIEAETEALRSEVTKRLEAALPSLRGELDRLSNRVVATALKEKARQLGDIEEISEDEETGDLTIKVRV